MIRAISVTNYRGESTRFELANPDDSGFAVRRVEGLGPVKASINTSNLATGDGATYNSARIDIRNIVMYLVFYKNDVEAVRHESYRLFPLKKNLTIKIETDTRICETVGYVETNEPDIFSSSEETQISIICPDPYLYASGDEGIVEVPYELDGQFEFPFWNDSLRAKKIQFLAKPNGMQTSVNNSGDVETGFTIRITCQGPVSGLRIGRVDSNEKMEIDDAILVEQFETGLDTGDELVINTKRGRKSIKLIRNGKTLNAINSLKSGATWFQLSPGINTFSIEAVSGYENLHAKFEYRLVYEGV